MFELAVELPLKGASPVAAYHCRTIATRLVAVAGQPKPPRVFADGSLSIRWQFGVSDTHFTMWVREREISWEAKIDGMRVAQSRFLPDYLSRTFERQMRKAQGAMVQVFRH